MRGSWSSQTGFLLAAVGSAVGLGNIWKFPYATARNGGGGFVLVYIVATMLIGVPVMIAEILVGRATQRSPVRAIQALAGRGSSWVGLGWLSVAAAFATLSFFGVVAGWTLHYVMLSAADAFSGRSAAEIGDLFCQLQRSPGLNALYLGVFIALCLAVVLGGVRAGIERWARILVPGLGVVLVVLLVHAATVPGFGEALRYVLIPAGGSFSTGAALEATGQAFLSLSVAMGVMLTFGSYLGEESDVPGMSLWVAGLDVLVALVAVAVIFPVVRSSEIEVQSGLGLVFQSIPVALARLRAGAPLCMLFFVLMVLAALTSAVSVLEVVISTVIDLGLGERRGVAVGASMAAFCIGLPSALSAGQGLFGAVLEQRTGRTFLMWTDHVVSNLVLPLSGFLWALFVGHRLEARLRHMEFNRGTGLAALEDTWQLLLRYVVPAVVLLVFLDTSGLLERMGRY